ncbi:hypothetical protein EKN56_15655 [Limnobaculum zhutongyuii]|uniref:Uncharacterized protein n=1 Tax=Limnobaculum zhutongyuii TaxID=2498113 RepID=A0A411WNB7_9GAMM|nr:GntR family transcriptional regulator YhfZ [Limnobaculum zhutongyuii]QBH97714.1 hypothetical protein EKN56_15655 [Limnobaculum zhutongyuii]TQS86817.1 hypothetical protein ELQ32_17365 [Limnobaculum zhutongyuii]
MSKTFIKKEGIAQSFLARYLLALQSGSRLKTIDELARECELSVGLMQSALKDLESFGALKVVRRGRNGSFIDTIDHKLLLQFANIDNVVCAMPLPYARVYEGLASGLKAQFADMPFYFAHMRGADIRVQCLENGIYDLAVTSRLAAEQHLKQGNIYIALALGQQSYAEQHKLIFRQGQEKNIQRIGIDSTSADQKIMTEEWVGGRDIEFVEVSYHECLNKIVSGYIDAAIWNVGQGKTLEALGLMTSALSGNESCYKASEAVILTRKDDKQIQQLVNTMLNRDALLLHQQQVVAGQIEPTY